MPDAATEREWPGDYARVVPFADVVALIDERNRLLADLAHAERERDKWRKACQAAESALRGVRAMRGEKA